MSNQPSSSTPLPPTPLLSHATASCCVQRGRRCIQALCSHSLQLATQARACRKFRHFSDFTCHLYFGFLNFPWPGLYGLTATRFHYRFLPYCMLALYQTPRLRAGFRHVQHVQLHRGAHQSGAPTPIRKKICNVQNTKKIIEVAEFVLAYACQQCSLHVYNRMQATLTM